MLIRTAWERVGALPLEHPGQQLRLLLPEQLKTVALELALDAAPLAVLAGGVVPLLDRALLREAAVALEEELHALPAAEATNRTDVSRHFSLLRRGAAWAGGNRCGVWGGRPGWT